MHTTTHHITLNIRIYHNILLIYKTSVGGFYYTLYGILDIDFKRCNAAAKRFFFLLYTLDVTVSIFRTSHAVPRVVMTYLIIFVLPLFDRIVKVENKFNSKNSLS